MSWKNIINKSCELGYTNSIIALIHKVNEMLPDENSSADLIRIETNGYLQRLEDHAGKTKTRGGIRYIHDGISGMLHHMYENHNWIGPDTYGTLNAEALELWEQYLECTGESLR